MEELSTPRRILLILALVLSLPTNAAAQERGGKARMEEATSRFQRGKELYEESDYAAALTEFKRAYELVPNYKLLYNIGQVSFQLQDYASALRSFSRYLQEGQGEISANRREEVQRDVDKLRTRVATLRVSTSKPGAEISVDDVAVGRTPLSEPLLVNAGRRRIAATLSGYASVTKVVEVAGQETLRVSLELSSSDAAVSTPPPPVTAPSVSVTAPAPKPPERLAPWIPWTVTGGLLVATAVTGVLAGGASSDLKVQLARYPGVRKDIDAASSKTRALALTTDVLGGLTLAAAGVSTVLMLNSAEPPKRASGRLDVGIGPGGLAVAGTF